MGRGTKTTEFLKECMSDALLRLMRDKPMERISINEITAAANVGRSTWFRNFSSKNEAVTFKLAQVWYRWAEEHGLARQRRYTFDNAADFFQFNYGYRHILQVIYNAKLQPAVYDAFYQVMMPQFNADAEECYQNRFFAYGLFGLLDEWIKRSFSESPEEMTDLFQKLMEGKTGLLT